MKTGVSFPVVGVGASAGGLRALEDFFKAVPDDAGMAFVILTHLAPDRTSFLTDILARHTGMAVEVASDGKKVEANHIYVLPPNASLTIAGGLLRLRETGPGFHERNPVDVFFASLALDCGERAVGVILSGNGRDGVLGVKAIKEQGGIVLAQVDGPSGPGFSGMPDSAIASGLVDFAVPVEAMAEKLAENARNLVVVDGLARKQPKGEDDQGARNACEDIYAVLRAQTGHDFSGYKTRTFIRRVQRRMQVHRRETLADYAALLQRQPEEATALFRDLLINVTAFFRDPEAFDALKIEVIPRLFEGRGASDAVRIWAPACATGEEVFSIAILLREHMDTMRAPPRVTIFATDIDEDALAVARAGRYPAALMEDMAPERRRRFFSAQVDSFVVAKEIRDLCVFSPHSVLRDPPFSRMDLISCRNLLIYFGAEAQRQVLPIFHYALRHGGYLFLGKSETVGRFAELFAPVDKKNCVFQARDTGVAARMPLFVNGLHPAPYASSPVGGAGPAVAPPRLTAETRILERFAPAHIVVTDDADIVHFSMRTGKYLEAAYGAPSRQLLTAARKELRLDLRAALREAIETRRPVVRNDIAFETDNRCVERVSLTIEPMLGSSDGRPLFLVVFEQSAPFGDNSATSAAPHEARNDGEAQVRIELRDTRERLQGTIEEYETALEELKSSNEELVSLNEETQSSNEELESTKEELQSLNEELQTVNHELYAKIEDLDRANADLTNLFASTNVATIFLDRELVIRSFTPAITQLFNIIATDKGRPLADLAIKLDYQSFQDDIAAVLQSGAPIERRLHKDQADAPYYLARLTPYRNASQELDGVVASFVDVTGLAQSEERQRSLIGELNHRVKNMLAVIVAITQQTLARAASPDDFAKAFFARIQAMARSHELLSGQNWGEVGVEEMVRQGLAPYFPANNERIALSGPAMKLPPMIALSFGMMIDELATNAVKYGALSNEAGHIAVEWSSSSHEGKPSMLTLAWRETGGPPVTAPQKMGFGLKVIKREVEYGNSGDAEFDFAKSGFSATFKVPLKAPPHKAQP